jgi:hypothetical protein
VFSPYDSLQVPHVVGLSLDREKPITCALAGSIANREDASPYSTILYSSYESCNASYSVVVTPRANHLQGHKKGNTRISKINQLQQADYSRRSEAG